MELVDRVSRTVTGLSCMVIAFFFSSRRRHTRYIGDWSSDVCSSDLASSRTATRKPSSPSRTANAPAIHEYHAVGNRSEERRVGKECRSRWSTYHEKKKAMKKLESTRLNQ